jgi:hypothetical protein
MQTGTDETASDGEADIEAAIAAGASGIGIRLWRKRLRSLLANVEIAIAAAQLESKGLVARAGMSGTQSRPSKASFARRAGRGEGFAVPPEDLRIQQLSLELSALAAVLKLLEGAVPIGLDGPGPLHYRPAHAPGHGSAGLEEPS